MYMGYLVEHAKVKWVNYIVHFLAEYMADVGYGTKYAYTLTQFSHIG
jgi:hypothetical protein